MRSAHIRHHRSAICPFTPAWLAGSMSLNGESAAVAANLTRMPRSSRGERWSAKPRPGRRALNRRFRTGGRMPPSSRTGMFGEGSRACCTRDGPGRARRRWCAARAARTFVTRSAWRRSPGNQLGPQARSPAAPVSCLPACPAARSPARPPPGDRRRSRRRRRSSRQAPVSPRPTLANARDRVKSRQVSCAMFHIQVCTTNHI